MISVQIYGKLITLQTIMEEKNRNNGNILSRIQKIAALEQTTIAKMEKSIGASKGVLAKAISQQTDIRAKWLTNLMATYPQYSAKWLLTGDGCMMEDNSRPPMIEEVEVENPPIIPASLSRTPGVDTLAVVRDSTDGMEICPVRVEGLPISFWHRVRNNALEPEFRKDDKIALLAYPPGEENPIPGMLYAVDTYSNGMLIRRLYPDADGYIGRSYNREEYPDIMISRSDIIRVYRVLVQVRTL